MNNKSTNVQVHNESESQAKSIPKATVVFYIYIYIYIFLFTRMKELVWTRTNWIWLNAKSLRINMFQTNTEKWVNFSVKVSLCIDVYRNARLRTSTNLYIISLAISDIINAVIVMPFIVGVLITGEWPFGEAVCDFHAFFNLFSVYVSPTTMGLTAFNRYVRIVKPQHYPRIFTDTRSKIYIAAVWLTVAGYISIPKMGGYWISLLRWIRRLHRWTTHRSLEDSSLYHCRLFFLSSSTRSCISFLLQGIQENKTSQSKHGFDGPRRGQRKSIDCQRDQAYQIARHCCVRLRTVLDSILDHCGDTALRFWCCRST